MKGREVSQWGVVEEIYKKKYLLLCWKTRKFVAHTSNFFFTLTWPPWFIDNYFLSHTYSSIYLFPELFMICVVLCFRTNFIALSKNCQNPRSFWSTFWFLWQVDSIRPHKNGHGNTFFKQLEIFYLDSIS